MLVELRIRSDEVRKKRDEVSLFVGFLFKRVVLCFVDDFLDVDLLSFHYDKIRHFLVGLEN